MQNLSSRCLDADISKCFDKINHQALLRKINTFPTLNRLIKEWLKAGVFDNHQWSPTEEGTPQGGVISPLLANIALHGMEEEINKVADSLPGNKKKNRYALSLIRYADDFLIIHPNFDVVNECKDRIIEWLKEMGLELKPSKTRITHTLNPSDNIFTQSSVKKRAAAGNLLDPRVAAIALRRIVYLNQLSNVSAGIAYSK
ncbi:reverse transcriptase/maturase family protein [Nostoc sp.]